MDFWIFQFSDVHLSVFLLRMFAGLKDIEEPMRHMDFQKSFVPIFLHSLFLLCFARHHPCFEGLTILQIGHVAFHATCHGSDLSVFQSLQLLLVGE